MKRPFMLLYVNEFLAHKNVVPMDSDQFAWYLRMLMRAWVNEPPCKIENTDEELMLAAGCTDAELWRLKKALVMKNWKPCNRKKYVVNNRLQEEFAKMLKAAEKKQEAGRKGGMAKAKQNSGGGQAPPSSATATLSDRDRDSDRDREKTKSITLASRPEATQQEVFIDLPLNDNTDFQISLLTVTELSQLYPAVNVPQEFRGMRAWLLSNREKRKTRRGVLRFANSWLAKEQDKNSRNGNHDKNADRAGKNEELLARKFEDADRGDS